MRVESERLTIILKYFYCIVIFILLMDRMDNVPVFIFSGLRKIKYLYLFFVSIYFMARSHGGRIKRKTVPALIVLFLILLHTVLWGVVFVNGSLKTETYIHMRELLILFAFIGGTAYLYGTSGSILEFAVHTYKMYILVLLWAGLTHFAHFVNPIKFIYVFSGSHTYRVTFGMGHANYVGSICCFALLCSVYWLENLRNHSPLGTLLQNKKALRIIIADIYIVEMLFSTASRTAILAFFIAIVVYIVYNANELFPIHGRFKSRGMIILIGCVVIVGLYFSGMILKLFSETHRDTLLSINMEIMSNYFSRWTGMGYINYSGFAYGTWLYGYETANADSYYAYIFFASGYLGAALIDLALFITGFYVYKAGKCKNNISGVMAFTSFLAIGIAQASLISYDHLISIGFWVLFLLEMSQCKNNTTLNCCTKINGVYCVGR